MADYPNLELTADNGIGVLRVTRPEKRGAFSDEMIESLGKLCRDIEARDDIAVLMITGHDGVFSAGGDIGEWGALEAREFAMRWVRRAHAAFDALACLRQPVIAVLGGHALGGGLELAAAADYRIAEAQCKIGQPESGLGIIPGWSGTQRAVRRFGSQTVRRMALFGEVFDAEEAARLGIVDVVVETGKGFDAGMEVARRYMELSPVAGELVKMCINAAEGEETERVLEALAGHIASNSDEAKEGVAAFREKRPADFGKAKSRKGKNSS